MKKSLALSALLVLGSTQVHAVDFTKEVLPILKDACYKCHSLEAKKSKGNLALDDMKKMAEAVAEGKMLVPGDAEKSGFYQSLTSAVDEDGHMPPKKTLELEKLEVIKAWINEGAKFTPGDVAAATAPATPGAPMAETPAPAAPAPVAPKAMELTPAQLANVAPETTWTSADGRSIKASFVEVRGDNITLRRSDGLVFVVQLSKLSEESQATALNGGIPTN